MVRDARGLSFEWPNEVDGLRALTWLGGMVTVLVGGLMFV